MHGRRKGGFRRGPNRKGRYGPDHGKYPGVGRIFVFARTAVHTMALAVEMPRNSQLHISRNAFHVRAHRVRFWLQPCKPL